MSVNNQAPKYQNNPFFVAIDGITVLFKSAFSVGIFFIVLSALSIIAQLIQSVIDFVNNMSISSSEAYVSQEHNLQMFRDTLAKLSIQDWTIIASIGIGILLALMTIGVILTGISDYTAARLAKGKKTTLGEAFKGVVAHFPGYLWLNILIGIRILLWSLLFIIPGIIMAVRYSLSGTAFFSENARGNKAIRRSTLLTKNAWLTTFGSYYLFNLLTFGIIQPVIQPGIQAVLYRQYAAYETAGKHKPTTHVLSWLALFIPILAIIAGISLLILSIWFLSILSTV